MRCSALLLALIACADGGGGKVDTDDSDVDDTVVDTVVDTDEGDTDTIDTVVDSDTDTDVDPCANPLPCPASTTAGTVTICGRLHDVATDAAIVADVPTGEACATATAAGPCSLRLTWFDALALAQDPAGASPLVPHDTVVDDCGRFRATDVPRASLGFLALVVDDHPDVTPDAPHRPTVVSFPNDDAPPLGRAYATRTATDATWSDDAGVSGMTLVDRGVLLLTFLHAGQPVAGVTVRRAGEPIADDDLYFSDAGVTRSTVDPSLDATGPDGSALILGSPTPASHGGSGGEPAGCTWPQRIAATVPGLVWVGLVEAEATGGGACP